MEFVDISNPSIMGGGFQREVEKKIVELCKLNYQEYLRNKSNLQISLLQEKFWNNMCVTIIIKRHIQSISLLYLYIVTIS